MRRGSLARKGRVLKGGVRTSTKALGASNTPPLIRTLRSWISHPRPMQAAESPRKAVDQDFFIRKSKGVGFGEAMRRGCQRSQIQWFWLHHEEATDCRPPLHPLSRKTHLNSLNWLDSKPRDKIIG